MVFKLDPSRLLIEVDPADVAALYQSVNQVTVVVPSETSAAAQAVVVGHRASDGFDVVIGLHLVTSGRHLVFNRGDQPVLDGEGARDAAREALAFVESMGFFMENANWNQLPGSERTELLDRLKVFSPPAERVIDTQSTLDPQTMLARLLVQF